ncbi:MAG: hypothetical protein VW397_01510 [Candidatus Margulisiibacteriota bacterium]
MSFKKNIAFCDSNCDPFSKKIVDIEHTIINALGQKKGMYRLLNIKHKSIEELICAVEKNNRYKYYSINLRTWTIISQGKKPWFIRSIPKAQQLLFCKYIENHAEKKTDHYSRELLKLLDSIMLFQENGTGPLQKETSFYSNPRHIKLIYNKNQQEIMLDKPLLLDISTAWQLNKLIKINNTFNSKRKLTIFTEIITDMSPSDCYHAEKLKDELDLKNHG